MGMLANPYRYAVAGGGAVGPISFVGSHAFTQAASTTVGQVINFSSLLDTGGGTPTVNANDFAILNFVVGSGVDTAYTPPSGWTELTEINIPFSLDTNHCIFYKVLNGVETSVTTPPTGDSSDYGSGQLFVFRGVDIVTPFDVAFTTASGTATGIPNPASITPSTAGSWPVVACGASTIGSSVFTNPGDLSSTTNHFRSIANSNPNRCISGMGIKTNWSSGAFDPGAWGGGSNNGADSWSAVTMALRSA